MEHDVTEESNLVIVALKGEIDLEYSAAAREILLEAAGKGAGIAVDLSGVTMIDSSGVASLLEALQSARHRDKGFILASVDESVLWVLKLARLDTVFKIADDIEAARLAIGWRSGFPPGFPSVSAEKNIKK
jgi:anti-sigma B factor antagonist